MPTNILASIFFKYCNLNAKKKDHFFEVVFFFCEINYSSWLFKIFFEPPRIAWPMSAVGRVSP